MDDFSVKKWWRGQPSGGREQDSCLFCQLNHWKRFRGWRSTITVTRLEFRMRLLIAFFTCSILPIATVSAGVVFYDDFEGDTPSANASLVNWDVTSGTIDVQEGVTPDSRREGAGWTVSDGNIVDLDGSASNGGIITTKQSFQLSVGEYLFSFRFSGSNDSFQRDDIFDFGLDGVYDNTLNVPYQQTVSTFTTTITITQSTSTKIYFDQDAGADNFGVFIDAVRLEAVPEPSTAIAMCLLGVVGFAGNRRRRRNALLA